YHAGMPHTNEGTPPHAHPTRSAGYLTIARLHTGTPLLADAHAAHRAVCAATHTSHGRVLWAHPTRRVLLIRVPARRPRASALGRKRHPPFPRSFLTDLLLECEAWRRS